jgi:hypothetical protein
VGMERDEIIIRIKNNYQEMNEIIIRIKGSYYEGSEVVRLGIEVVTLENVSRIALGRPYKGLCKINKQLMKDYKKSPIYRFFQIFITRINKL